ncbi:transposase [Actinokineospora pegani]|uniref:transposase n=1 Tax=Actinokineospora pegani TaxID=2654637 RepID=UPI0038B3F666
MFTAFLDRMARQADRKVHVVADRHPVHRSKAVRAWLQDNAERVELHLMPGYSPELNPDELLGRRPQTRRQRLTRPQPRPPRPPDPTLPAPPPTPAAHHPRLLRCPTRPLRHHLGNSILSAQ